MDLDAMWKLFAVESFDRFDQWIQSMDPACLPLPQSSIWLQTFDGAVHELEPEIAKLLRPLCRQSLQPGEGMSMRSPLVLPREAGFSSGLKLSLKYLRFYRAPSARSNKQQQQRFFVKFINLDTPRLCELLTAAWSLELSPLVDLTTRDLARVINELTGDEFQEAFHLPYNLTEWGNQETMDNLLEELSPSEELSRRNKLINQLVAWKRRSLEDKMKQENERALVGNRSAAAGEHDAGGRNVHERSVEELLSFIKGTGPNEDGRGRANWKEKPNRRTKTSNKKELDLSFENNRTESTQPLDDIQRLTDDCSRSIQGSKLPEETEDTQEGLHVVVSDSDMQQNIDREAEELDNNLTSCLEERKQQIYALVSYSLERIRENNNNKSSIPEWVSSIPAFVSDESANSDSQADQSLSVASHNQAIAAHTDDEQVAFQNRNTVEFAATIDDHREDTDFQSDFREVDVSQIQRREDFQWDFAEDDAYEGHPSRRGEEAQARNPATKSSSSEGRGLCNKFGSHFLCILFFAFLFYVFLLWSS